ncbi:hypothetical protein FNF27_04197 [Cafeteria roenbergensis]|uniref:Pre-toxin TG domain-containing protein n=1 Tax=Cafeteria roenbergensis TaxID=33653 RepID=A0A5A8EB02_CAFRO|nr:hypothetical protein FNF27_04197 [Cafeteria roenbergensis]
MTTLRVNKDLRIMGRGKFTGKRRSDAIDRVEGYTGSTRKSSAVVDKVSGMTNKQFKLSKGNREKAVVLVMQELECTRREAQAIVRRVVKHVRATGAGFWDSIWNGIKSVGKSIVGAIPLVGGIAKEGLDALDKGRKFNWKSAGLDTAIGLLPGGALVRGGVDAGLRLSGARKTITGKGMYEDVRDWHRDASKYVQDTAEEMGEHLMTGAKNLKRHVGLGKPNPYAMLVKKVMKQTGLSMIDASKLIKQRGLYKKKMGAGRTLNIKRGGARTRSGVQYEEPAPVRRPRPACDAMARRGRLVSKLMRENPGMNLGQASRYIKEHNLAY